MGSYTSGMANSTDALMVTNRILNHAIAANRPGVPQAKLAAELGVSPGYYHAITKCRNELKFSTLDKLIQKLGVAADAMDYIRLLEENEIEELRAPMQPEPSAP